MVQKKNICFTFSPVAACAIVWTQKLWLKKVTWQVTRISRGPEQGFKGPKKSLNRDWGFARFHMKKQKQQKLQKKGIDFFPSVNTLK